jgi:hypothetical protein
MGFLINQYDLHPAEVGIHPPVAASKPGAHGGFFVHSFGNKRKEALVKLVRSPPKLPVITRGGDHMRGRLSFICLLLVAGGMIPAHAQKYYNPDILGIISAHGCAGCHGGSGGLTVTPYSSIFSTGNHAPVVVANDSNSVLVLKLKGIAGFGSRMPLGGPYLSESEIKTVIQWIMEGARESATTDIATDSGTPAEFALSQNFPNPFNPSTTIAYRVPGSGSGMVRLSVYDDLGQEVAVLVNEYRVPGGYEATFDATGLSSGVYLYRLTAGNFVQARKMLLLR